MMFWDSIDFINFDMARLDAANFKECMEKCLSRDDCNAMMYNSKMGHCWLKSQVQQIRRFIANHTSAIRCSYDRPSTWPSQTCKNILFKRQPQP